MAARGRRADAVSTDPLNPMLSTPTEHLAAPGLRFSREPSTTGTGRRYALEGDARPGDVLALAGGALVLDANENGRVDGFDEIVDDGRAARRYGLLVDVRA